MEEERSYGWEMSEGEEKSKGTEKSDDRARSEGGERWVNVKRESGLWNERNSANKMRVTVYSYVSRVFCIKILGSRVRI